jgi:hypothetical protein
MSAGVPWAAKNVLENGEKIRYWTGCLFDQDIVAWEGERVMEIGEKNRDWTDGVLDGDNIALGIGPRHGRTAECKV